MFQIDPTDQIGIIGLGYVGLPLAIEFGKICPAVGFDIQPARIEELKYGTDRTLEVSQDELSEATQLTYTTESRELANCKVFIVTVPTPINKFRQPDLEPLIQASKTIAGVLKKGCVVIYLSLIHI